MVGVPPKKKKTSPHCLGPPVVPFYPFFGEGSPTKIEKQTQATLILTSLLEDLVVVVAPSEIPQIWSCGDTCPFVPFHKTRPPRPLGAAKMFWGGEVFFSRRSGRLDQWNWGTPHPAP